MPAKIEIVIKEVVGDDVLPLVKFLMDNKDWSEFELAEKMKKEVNEIRNLLYKLHKHNLVDFRKKKDDVRGWYVYYWYLNKKRTLEMEKEVKQQKIKGLADRLVRERQSQFFICGNKCVRLDFEQVVNMNFNCPECGSILEQDDNARKIQDIEKELTFLKSII